MRLSWVYWFLILVIWTALLVAPGDWFFDQGKHQIGGLGIGKFLHIGFYALLAASAGWLRLSLNWRMALIPLLVLHGGFTEWMQTFVPFREGCWRDVGIDSLSVLTGFLLTWRWWPA